jgi:pyruvate,water dikinase
MAELGRRLHAEGHLEEPRHVMMATDDELDMLVADPASLTGTLAHRCDEWRELFDVEIPIWVDGRKPISPMSELPRRGAKDVKPAEAGDVLQGQGASAGVARGTARVVLDTANIAEFQPGEILVAPQTDPSWTPLFMVSGAVVVDTGAMGSHAMIVSRELGIPCAAGVTEATRRIPTGATVEVDGSTGTVTVISA